MNKKRVRLIIVLLIIATIILLTNCGLTGGGGTTGGTPDTSFDIDVTSDVDFAGLRSSHYGVDPFPSASSGLWGVAMNNMTTYFKGSKAVSVWIIGTITNNGECRLEFPESTTDPDDPYIIYSTNDKHEPYLDYFDANDMYVYLQVESGLADMEKLIDIVLTRYSHHPSVIGFGVDVEWYKALDPDNMNCMDGCTVSVPVTDQAALTWEQKVKSYNTDYTLFLKHWEPEVMPTTYRGQIVFLNDSQDFGRWGAYADDPFRSMVEEFTEWANLFTPNTVMYQIGYSADYNWWQDLSMPIKTMGETLAVSIKAQNPTQKVGITWVDFTLRYPGVDLFTPLD